jgi:hypothetical protein
LHLHVLCMHTLLPNSRAGACACAAARTLTRSLPAGRSALAPALRRAGGAVRQARRAGGPRARGAGTHAAHSAQIAPAGAAQTPQRTGPGGKRAPCRRA